VLRGGGIRLRPVEAKDAPRLILASSDPAIRTNTFFPDDLTENTVLEWIVEVKGENCSAPYEFAIADDPADRLVGNLTLAVTWRSRSAEVCYWVLPGFRGRGIATTAVGVGADWAFDRLGVERLSLLTEPSNLPSQAVAQRCGFAREGVLRAYEPFKGRRPDLVSWSLLSTDQRPWNEMRNQPSND
jgi:RimJ/RimL family protein N-acetyltransferase